MKSAKNNLFKKKAWKLFLFVSCLFQSVFLPWNLDFAVVMNWLLTAHCVSSLLRRFYFKKVSDEFDCGVVFEEVRDDDAVLPIFEEKIIGKVEKVDWHSEFVKVREWEVSTLRTATDWKMTSRKCRGGNSAESETKSTEGKKKLNCQGRDKWGGGKRKIGNTRRGSLTGWTVTWMDGGPG